MPVLPVIWVSGCVPRAFGPPWWLWGGVWFSSWWLGGALACWATDAGVSSIEWLSSGVEWGMGGCGGGCGTGIWTGTFISADGLS